MSKLNAVEISKEVDEIVNRSWPYKTMLFVKNLYDHRVGAIYRENNQIVPQVRLGAGSFIPYSSISSLVEAGWVAD